MHVAGVNACGRGQGMRQGAMHVAGGNACGRGQCVQCTRQRNDGLKLHLERMAVCM